MDQLRFLFFHCLHRSQFSSSSVTSSGEMNKTSLLFWHEYGDLLKDSTVCAEQLNELVNFSKERLEKIIQETEEEIATRNNSHPSTPSTVGTAGNDNDNDNNEKDNDLEPGNESTNIEQLATQEISFI